MSGGACSELDDAGPERGREAAPLSGPEPASESLSGGRSGASSVGTSARARSKYRRAHSRSRRQLSVPPALAAAEDVAKVCPCPVLPLTTSGVRSEESPA